jgi:hypothetical protein
MTGLGTHGRLFITFRRRHGVLTEPDGSAGGTHQSRNPRAARAMTSDEEFTQLGDPEFLAERRRVREALEHTPDHEVSASLADRYKRLNDEFLRRARLAWTQVSQGKERGR